MPKKPNKKLAQIFVKCPKHDKVLHRTKDIAKAEAKKFRKNFGSKMDIYPCTEYIGFHIGHNRAHKGRKAGKKKYLFPRIK